MRIKRRIKVIQPKRIVKKRGTVTVGRLSGPKEAEDKNKLSLEDAKNAFVLKAVPLFDDIGRTHGLGDMLLNILKTFGSEPSTAWANAEPFCIDYIECIRVALTAGAAVYYDTYRYDEAKGVVPSGSTYCICEESKFANSVVLAVRRYFQNAAIVAKKVESSTFTEWRNGLVIIKKNCFGNSEDRCTDEQASEIVGIIEENCEKLAADVQIWLAEQEDQSEDGRGCDRALILFGKSVLRDPKPPRTKGTSPYHGNVVHPSIFIQPGEYISVDNKKYAFTGGDQWVIINRFLKSIKDGENNNPKHYPVPFTTADSNKCTGGCAALESDYVERQPAAQKIRNQRYGEKARFKVELLKKRRYQ